MTLYTGSEWHILNGATHILREAMPTFIMFEWSPQNINRRSERQTAAREVVEMIMDAGYYVFVESCMGGISLDTISCPNNDREVIAHGIETCTV